VIGLPKVKSLGSVVALTNSNGAVVERYDYDPYGTTYILDPAGVPLQLLPVDPWAADGYFHDHDQDGDLDAADYTDLMACANDTPYDPMCIYTHGERSERRGVAGPSCPPPTDEGGSEVDMVGRNSAQGCKRPAPRPARRRVGTRLAAGGRNGDRRVDSYEWDYQHGGVEKYDKRGHHLGEYDPDTGAITKEGDPGRCMESSM